MDLNAAQRGNSHLAIPTVPAKRSQGEADIDDRDGGGWALRDWAGDGDVSGSSVAGLPIDHHSYATIHVQHQPLHHLSIPEDSFPTSPLHDSQPYPSPALIFPPTSSPNTSPHEKSPDLSCPSIALNQSGNVLSES
jgi:hypothetical protein